MIFGIIQIITRLYKKKDDASLSGVTSPMVEQKVKASLGQDNPFSVMSPSEAVSKWARSYHQHLIHRYTFRKLHICMLLQRNRSYKVL
ncbi:hypothetical protein CEXT_2861 [Caerostris extrusa]|uniref:Uncharacterized protein n=1 Tax=Caerostris extrusa TaxID=172846 RepID=A0AAV4MML7_CAEEX|nr:hypothetical protein CEXT_2861 [Caerostris extrusa]